MMKKRDEDKEQGYWIRLIFLLLGIVGVGALVWFTCWKFLPQMAETPEMEASSFAQNTNVNVEKSIDGSNCRNKTTEVLPWQPIF